MNQPKEVSQNSLSEEFRREFHEKLSRLQPEPYTLKDGLKELLGLARPAISVLRTKINDRLGRHPR